MISETEKIKIAGIQMASGPNVNANLIESQRLITLAANAGAQLIVLPENFAFLGLDETDKLGICEQLDTGPIQGFLADQAAKNKVWLVGGTIPLESGDPGKIRAATILYDDHGKRVAHYDKTHLFDVHIIDSDERYIESETIEPGDQVVVANTPFGKMGLAVCYDLRFPELFRSMVDLGAELLVIPSAFTAITGKAHWEILVRARAIENLCYVIAAGQGGYHVNGRESYGDSMVVNPWGQILDRLVNGSGYVIAEYDRNYLNSVRTNFPVLKHRKLSCDI